MADGGDSPHDVGDDGLTRAGRAAHRARLNALRGNRQARADLDVRWAALGRDDPSTTVPLVGPGGPSHA